MKKKFLEEIKNLEQNHRRPATLTLKIAPSDDLFDVQPTEIVIKSEDRAFLKELAREADYCARTGNPPEKLAKLIKEAHEYGPPPSKAEKDTLIYSSFTPHALNLSDCDDSKIIALQQFIDRLSSFVPDITEAISGGFTNEQKYILRFQKNTIRWLALGLFHRIFGGIPDVLADESCPLNNHPLKTQIINEINLRSAHFQLIAAGDKYIRDFVIKQGKFYPFSCPLELFLEIFRDSVERGNDSILYGEKDFSSKRKVAKAQAAFRRFIRGALEGREKTEVENSLLNEGWTGVVALALAPHYASRTETYFKALWDIYLDATDSQTKLKLNERSVIFDSEGNFFAVGPSNKRKQLKIYWQDDKLLLAPEL